MSLRALLLVAVLPAAALAGHCYAITEEASCASNEDGADCAWCSGRCQMKWDACNPSGQGCWPQEICPTSVVSASKVIDHVCLNQADDLYGNSYDPACGGCVEPSNNRNTEQLCAPPLRWVPLTCAVLQEQTQVSECPAILGWLQSRGKDCCAPMCDANQLNGLIQTMSEDCQATLGQSMSTGVPPSQEDTCRCLLEVDEYLKVDEQTAREYYPYDCIVFQGDETTLHEIYRECKTLPSPSPSPSPSPYCGELRAAYKASKCCRTDKMKELYKPMEYLVTCGDVKIKYQALACCTKQRKA